MRLKFSSSKTTLTIKRLLRPIVERLCQCVSEDIKLGFGSMDVWITNVCVCVNGREQLGENLELNEDTKYHLPRDVSRFSPRFGKCGPAIPNARSHFLVGKYRQL